MDWIHCNICFYQPGQMPKRTFLLTNCGHLFCHLCEKSGTIQKCKICGARCNTTQLSAQMQKEVQIYFEDPEETQAKLVKVMEFQRTHRVRLNENYRKLVMKYQKLKVAYQKIEDRLKRQENDLRLLRDANNQLSPPMTPSPLIPIFNPNSQQSQIQRRDTSQQSNSNTPFFLTPSPGGHNWRAKQLILQTPSSEGSISPKSVGSSYRGSSQQQSPYSPLRLSPLSIHPRSSGRF